MRIAYPPPLLLLLLSIHSYYVKDILLQNFIDFYIVNIYNITQQFDIYYVKILLDTVKLMRPVLLKLVLREIAMQFRSRS